jgi:TatD DNase family protein
MFVETDSPFLTPVPYRGKRNEPAYVRLVAETVASVKNISLEDVARVTTENVQNLFKI